MRCGTSARKSHFRVYTHGTLRAARRRSEHAGTAKLRGCQVRTTFRRFGNVASGRFWHVQRAPACRYALWRRAPLLGPPPWPPMVPTSAARRPIALRREPTVSVHTRARAPRTAHAHVIDASSLVDAPRPTLHTDYSIYSIFLELQLPAPHTDTLLRVRPAATDGRQRPFSGGGRAWRQLA